MKEKPITDYEKDIAVKAAKMLAPLIQTAGTKNDTEKNMEWLNDQVISIGDKLRGTSKEGDIDWDVISEDGVLSIGIFDEGFHDFDSMSDMIKSLKDIQKSLSYISGIDDIAGKERSLPEEQELERDENMSENSKLDMLEQEINHIQQEEPKQDADTDRLEFCIAEQMKSGKVSREEAVNMCKRQRSVGMEDGVAMAQQAPPEAEVQGAPMAVDDASMANGMYQQLTPMKMATGVISASATPFTALWSEISDDMNKILERLERIIAGNPGG
jgi:hypothetical protein